MGEIRESCEAGAHDGCGASVMERRKLVQFLHALEQRVVDARWRLEVSATVNDAIANGIGARGQALEHRGHDARGVLLAGRPFDQRIGDRLGVVEQRGLEGARARVEDEHPHRSERSAQTTAPSPGAPGQAQSRISGASSPCSRV